MNINIKGNPGTGNTYQEITIQHVENYNPAATSVTNNYYGTRAPGKKAASTTPSDEAIDIAPIREEIINYVSRLRPFLVDKQKSGYIKLWREILDLDIIAGEIYNPGKQQGTNFNRSLVANIIYYMAKKNFFGDENSYNSSQFAVALEGSAERSVRAELRMLPAADIISRLDCVLENRELIQNPL